LATEFIYHPCTRLIMLPEFWREDSYFRLT